MAAQAALWQRRCPIFQQCRLSGICTGVRVTSPGLLPFAVTRAASGPKGGAASIIHKVNSGAGRDVHPAKSLVLQAVPAFEKPALKRLWKNSQKSVLGCWTWPNKML
jgi:hypothetical protein